MYRPSIVLFVCLGACSSDGEPACENGFSLDENAQMVCNDPTGGDDSGGDDSGTNPTADTDEDGVLDVDEAALGTDPTNPDSDGDGMLDGDEVSGGTDPTDADTDGDGYIDGWETDAGTDPNDADSVIYQGGWPYNPDKDQYEDRNWSHTGLDEGDPLAYATFLDQYGDEVDVYDFANQGRPIMLSVDAMWCGPCQGIARWLAGDDDPFAWETIAPMVDDAVQAGDVYWIAVLGQSLDYDTYEVTVDDLEQWSDAFPHPRIPVLADNGDAQEGDVVRHLLDGAWPTVILYDEHLEVLVGPGDPNGADFFDPITELENMLEDGKF